MGDINPDHKGQLFADEWNGIYGEWTLIMTAHQMYVSADVVNAFCVKVLV